MQALTIYQRSLTTMQIQIQGLLQFAVPLFPTAEVRRGQRWALRSGAVVPHWGGEAAPAFSYLELKPMPCHPPSVPSVEPAACLAALSPAALQDGHGSSWAESSGGGGKDRRTREVF